MHFHLTSLYGPFDLLQLKEWWGISGPVLQAVSTCLFFFSFHVWLTWFCLSCNTGVEEEMRQRYHWSIDAYSIWSFCLSLLILILFEPFAHCGMKLARARDQTGCDCSDLIWASVKQIKCFYLCACACVNHCAQRYQRKLMQSLSVFRVFSFKHVQGC